MVLNYFIIPPVECMDEATSLCYITLVSYFVSHHTSTKFWRLRPAVLSRRGGEGEGQRVREARHIIEAVIIYREILQKLSLSNVYAVIIHYIKT